jgi:hypothetical protein
MGIDSKKTSASDEDRPLGNAEFAARVLWIALRLLLVIWMAEAGQSFVYQSF